MAIAWCAVLMLMAQPLCRVTAYDEEDGLPHGHVTHLLQDENGFMWFSTWNGKGNVNKNRSTVDQLIQKADGNYKVVETKLTEGTSKLSKGQEAVQKHVKFGNKNFEVRSNNKDLRLTKGMTIHVDDYEVVYKYKK